MYRYKREIAEEAHWDTYSYEYAPFLIPDGLDRKKTWFRPRTTSLYERMNIVPDGGSKTKWKDVEHYKFRRTTVGSLASYTHHDGFTWTNNSATSSCVVKSPIETPSFPYSSVNVYGPYDEPFVGLTAFHDSSSEIGFIPYPFNLDELLQRALSTMMPQIKAELSLINSVIELKDFAGLAETISGVLKAGLIYKAGQTLRRIRHATADSYLQAKFNILPLLSDICGIQAALSRTERRINDLIARSGRVQERHFSHSWPEFTDVIESREGNIGNNSAQSSTDTRRVIHQYTKFHAECQFNYNYTGYQIAHARLLSLLDAFGVNLNPAIIWNAIPWSFVVDWVFGVSRFLNQFATYNMEPKINIRQFLWSVKRQRDIRLTTRLNAYMRPGVLVLQSSETTLPIVTETAYRRVVGMPSYSSILSSGLNSSEFTLGAALIASQKRRHHKTS